MSIWNVQSRRPRKVVLEVRKIIQRWPEHSADLPAIKFVDQYGKENLANMLTREVYENIQPGWKVILTYEYSLKNERFEPVKPPRKVQVFLDSLQKKLQGLFYVLACEHCQIMTFVEYDEGDDSQLIIERLLANHRKNIKQGCPGTLVIYDHLGNRRDDLAKMLSFQRVS